MAASKGPLKKARAVERDRARLIKKGLSNSVASKRAVTRATPEGKKRIADRKQAKRLSKHLRNRLDKASTAQGESNRAELADIKASKAKTKAGRKTQRDKLRKGANGITFGISRSRPKEREKAKAKRKGVSPLIKKNPIKTY